MCIWTIHRPVPPAFLMLSWLIVLSMYCTWICVTDLSQFGNNIPQHCLCRTQSALLQKYRFGFGDLVHQPRTLKNRSVQSHSTCWRLSRYLKIWTDTFTSDATLPTNERWEEATIEDKDFVKTYAKSSNIFKELSCTESLYLSSTIPNRRLTIGNNF